MKKRGGRRMQELTDEWWGGKEEMEENGRFEMEQKRRGRETKRGKREP